MSFGYSIEIQGVKQVQEKLDRGAAAARNMKPALWLVREDMFRINKIQFESQGHRGGGSWKALDEKYLARKEREGRDPRILFSKRNLFRSFTQRGSRYMRSAVTNDLIYLSSTLPYADTHQYGDASRGIPARPYIRILPGDRQRWVKICFRYLQEAMRGV